VKSSFHSLTLSTQLSLSCHFFSIILDCHLKRLPQLFSAGQGSLLYSLGADRLENNVSNVISQQYFDYCLRNRCSGNLFTESLLSNGLLLMFSIVMSQCVFLRSVTFPFKYSFNCPSEHNKSKLFILTTCDMDILNSNYITIYLD
jgi:hypothetical protein